MRVVSQMSVDHERAIAGLVVQVRVAYHMCTHSRTRWTSVLLLVAVVVVAVGVAGAVSAVSLPPREE